MDTYIKEFESTYKRSAKDKTKKKEGKEKDKEKEKEMKSVQQYRQEV